MILGYNVLNYYCIYRTKASVSSVLLSSILFVNKTVLMLCTCGKGSGTGPVLDDNVNTCNPPTVNMFSKEFFCTPLLRTPNRGPRVSEIARVDRIIMVLFC